MILVVGGTGHLGSALIPRLLAGGAEVRVLSRNADAVVADGCEVIVGDVRTTGAVAEAVSGCYAVISAFHGFMGGHGAGPDEIDRVAGIGLIDAARQAGARRFLQVSACGAAPDHPSSLLRAKHAAEQHLVATDLDWTILRPTTYLEVWLEIVRGKLDSGGPALVLGRGENPINFVSVQDVAAVIEHCLAHPPTYRRVIDVAGTQNLTLLDLAQAQDADKIKHVPLGALRALQHLAKPFSPAFARQAAMGVQLDTIDMTAPASPDDPRPHRTLDNALAR
jgi:NADH dehydrogenase